MALHNEIEFEKEVCEVLSSQRLEGMEEPPGIHPASTDLGGLNR
jgi:hypothetical protein